VKTAVLQQLSCDFANLFGPIIGYYCVLIQTHVGNALDNWLLFKKKKHSYSEAKHLLVEKFFLANNGIIGTKAYGQSTFVFE